MSIQGHTANLEHKNHSAVRNSVSDMANTHKGLHRTTKRLKFILLCASLNTQNTKKKSILKLVACVCYVTWHMTWVCEPYKTRFQATKHYFIMGLYRQTLHVPHFQCWYLVSIASKYVQKYQQAFSFLTPKIKFHHKPFWSFEYRIWLKRQGNIKCCSFFPLLEKKA